MGLARFFYNNLITDESMLTVSSLRPGLVTTALKQGSGSASMATSGSFTGTVDMEYIVEIDSIAGGAEVGQATYRWSDGQGAWNASGVATSASAALLNNGVYVTFASGSGADFVVGDAWYFKAVNLFSAGKMIDLNRDSLYRSSVLESPNTIVIDLGSAQLVNSLAIFDHNLTSAATITLEANVADAWGAPSFSEAIAYNAEKILHYLGAAQTYRYWRISITDAANPDNYISMSELFLGTYLELSKNFRYGMKETDNILLSSTNSPYGKRNSRFYNFQRSFEMSFSGMPDSDITALRAMYTAIADRSAGTIKPIFFNKDSATPSETFLVDVAPLVRTGKFINQNDTGLQLIEVVKSV